MDELFTLYAKDVYGPLISYSFSSMTEKEINNFKIAFKKLINSKETEFIRRLIFDSNWRTSMVGGWLAFKKNSIELTDDIGKALQIGKAGVTGYCFALAKFGTAPAAKYLIDYLDKELVFDKFPQEKFQDLALNALMYIDESQNTIYTKEVLKGGGLWDNFINFEQLPNRALSNFDRWGNMTKNYSRFKLGYEFIEQI